MSAFKELIGESINGIFIGNENSTLVFRTIYGKWIRFDADGDCCNTVWFNHISGIPATMGDGNVFDILRGSKVISVEDKGWETDTANYDEYVVIEDGFWTIKTDRGYIDIEVRNSHNGYYGGRVEYVEYLNLSEIDDFHEITEDF